MTYNSLMLTALISGFLISPAWALNLQDTPIQKVTVYPNGALVERIISVKAGDQLIQLDGLPANFDMSLLKVQSENIDVTAVTNIDSAINKPSGRESAQLQQHIKQVEQQIAQLDAKIQAAELQNKFLANATSGNAATVRQQAYDAFLSISVATQEKQTLEQRLQELQQDLNQIGDHHFNQRSLQFHVQAPRSGVINLAYQVPYATWRPTYKAELNTQTQQLTLTRMAMIAQKTGEDWDNVQLTLSTNTPQGTIAQIQPQNWVVNFQEFSNQHYEVAMAPPSPIMAEPMLERTSNKDMGAPRIPQFEQVQQTYSTQFTTTTKASIPSSQQQISLPLDQQKMAAKLNVWVIPQQQDRGFLSATVPRVSGDWPSGLVKLYRDGDYVGQRQWQNPTSDQLHFNFGEDQQILVKTVNPKTEQDQSGTLSKQIVQVQSKQYEITNLHQQNIDVLLFESIPQSQNNALKISSQFSQQPTATEWQGQKNIYQWQQQLSPKQQFKLDIQYQFKYPKEGYVTGF